MSHAPLPRMAMRIAVLFLILTTLVACGAPAAPAAPQVVEKVVTQVVEKEKIVEKVQTQVVEKEKVVEKVVTPTAAPTVGGDLTIAFPNDAVFGPLYEAMWKDFQEKYPDIKLNIIWNGDQNKLIPAGEPLCLLHGGDVWPKELKMSLDLEPFIAADPTFDISQFDPASLEPLKIDGKLKALAPWYNISLLYYNKKLFDEAGIKYPTADWTKDDFLTAAKALTKFEGGKPTQWGVEMSHGWWGSWLIFVRQAGGDWMDTKSCKVTLDTPEAIDGMKYFVSLVQEGPDKVSWLPKEDSLGGFQGGKVAMSYGSHTGYWNTFRSAGVDFDVVQLPAGIKQQAGGEQALDGWSIYKDCPNPQAAWEALKWITSYDAGYKYYSNVGPSTRMDVQKAITETPIDQRTRAPRNLESTYAAFNEKLGMGLPRHLGFVEATQNHVQPIIDEILEGKVSVEEGMKQANQAAQDYLDSTYPDCADSTY